MVQNILFDMGGVLIRWDPALFSRRLNLHEADRRLLVREVYGELEWVHMDYGDLSEAEAVASICRRVPERLHGAVEQLVLRWHEPSAALPGALDLVRDLSEAGYRLYLLSNAGPGHSAYWAQFPVSAYFAGRVFVSSAWHILKPDRAFFETALSHFGLERETCVFTDDVPLNVFAAARCGLDGIVYHGPEDLREKLRTRGVRI